MIQIEKMSERFGSVWYVFEEIERMEAEQGGAWTWADVYGAVDIYRAENRAGLHDSLVDAPRSGDKGKRVVRWKGEWTTFTEAQVVKDQNRAFNNR